MKKREFKHFTWNNRLQLEAFLIAGMSKTKIAEKLHKHISSVYREIKRGTYEHLNSDYTTEQRYSPDIAQAAYEQSLAAKGGDLKIGTDKELANHIEKKIVKEKYSPAAVLGEIKAKGMKFKTTICVSTLYSYIDKGIFLDLTNKDLPVKPNKKKQSYKKVHQKRKIAGKSIEERPKEIDSRDTFGHWEMDCVEGAKRTKATLLVLTERKTRKEIVMPMKAKTAECVVAALDTIEKNYRELFKKVFLSITTDNGSEFSDVDGIERSIYGGTRTTTYHCHPYSSWERGSNENTNKMVRRHYPKGCSFEGVPDCDIKVMQNWINDYPRGIFDYHSSQELFNKEMRCFL